MALCNPELVKVNSRKMKAWAVTEFGSSDKLKVLELPKPEPTERDLLVKVAAVAVNPVDWKKRTDWNGFGGTITCLLFAH